MNIDFVYEYFLFHTMTLDQQKYSLLNLHRDLSLTINPAVITAINHKVTSEINTIAGSGQATSVKKRQPYNK